MKRLFLIFSLCFFDLLSLFSQSDFVISEKQKELAIFYYEVGKRYIGVGKVKKGRQFQSKALKIYPELAKDIDIKSAVKELADQVSVTNKPGLVMLEDVKIEEIPGIKHETIEINETTNAPKIEYIAQREKEKNQSKIIKFQFDKFVRALIFQNFNLIDSILADEIAVMGNVETKDCFISMLSDISSEVRSDLVDFLSVDDFYDLKSLKISKGGDGSFIIKINAKKNDLTKNFAFWNARQTLVFTKQQDNNWFLSSIR